MAANRNIAFTVRRRCGVREGLGTAHRVPAIKAAVAGAVADGDRAAIVAYRGVFHKVLELVIDPGLVAHRLARRREGLGGGRRRGR